MMRSLFAASLAVASLTSIASADLIFQAGTQTGSRYNPQANPADERFVAKVVNEFLDA